MPNHLADTNSPYLLQHANNPVDWYPWGPEALARAKREDKPILLSIGYAACHWCHVMAHESFEDPEIASIMNEKFVNIKVDREERPDLDNLYMSAVVAMIGQGGWPLNVFLTPQGQPFFGGTYFPPVPRYNMPSFRDILLRVTQIWQNDRAGLLQSGEEITRYLVRINQVESRGDTPNPQIIEQAALSLIQSYDWRGGGWGQAPKFPHPMSIEYLLLLGSQGNQRALDVACHALSCMAQGGMYDILGGGFSRYSTDNTWLIPHFEKMLYDNAQLARLYLQAYLITGDSSYRNICEATLDFIQREMTNDLGGFFSSLDADSEGEEGKYYLWTAEEIEAAIGDESQAEFYLTAFNITKEGNFAGRNILRQDLTDVQLAEKYHLGAEDVHERIVQLNRKLHSARKERIKPGIDDKSITFWNALTLQAYAEAARYLNREDYLRLAIRNAEFILNHLLVEGKLFRSWRNGAVSEFAFLEDYAALIIGLLSLYQSNPDVRWFQSAIHLTQDALTHYGDPRGGFFDTHDEQTDLIIRPKVLTDNATPSGNAMISLALSMMYAFQGEQRYFDEVEKSSNFVFIGKKDNIFFSSKWLCALYHFLNPYSEIVLVGDIVHPKVPEFLSVLWAQFRPNLVAAITSFPPPEGSPNITKDRLPLHNLPTAYLCERFSCQQPTNDPRLFSIQLSK